MKCWEYVEWGLVENGNEGRFLFPLFFEKWEKEPSLIPIFPLFLLEKWEKEPSLIPSSPHYPRITITLSNTFGGKNTRYRSA